ncbi:hypothetical protein DPMN_006533 [Dreissena polymorpha]|uniref:Uncharacterized protein n=1 Tax=Dreissena polymorpha TaxID=45954 RepID=A0A9D4MU69_DREPO|nr:hypothetical protein DPMN_006533 [Dreissena polymorpha]
MDTTVIAALITISTISLYETIGTGFEVLGNIALTMVMKTTIERRTVIQYETRSPDSGTKRNTNRFRTLRNKIGNSTFTKTYAGLLLSLNLNSLANYTQTIRTLLRCRPSPT